MLDARPKSKALGADLRAIRKQRGLTLVALAHCLDRSVGWLSQVERDISEPTLDDLRAFAQALDVPLSILLAGETGPVVRAEARRKLGPRVEGLTEELLSPDLTDEFEVVHSTFEAGAARTEPVKRPTQELATVVSGRMDVTVGDDAFTVGPGDSFRIRGEAFTWANPYDDPCVAIWVIAPPVY